MRSASSRGLTLIELMVALTVLGMALLVLMPEMTEWTRNTRVRNAAESVQNGIQKARMEAMRRNANVTLWLVSTVDASCALSAASASWVVSVDDPSSSCATAPSTTTAPRIVETYSSRDGSSNVTVNAKAGDNTTAATSITFNGFGQMVNSTSDIRFVEFTNSVSGTRNLRVTVAPGGAVRMCDPNAPSGDTRAC